MSEFSKKYNPDSFEAGIYKSWEETGKFKPNMEAKDSFYIPLPPPNVTGILHLGHALTLTLEDIMIRYARMSGKATLWLPGTDHAGIATQAKVEQKLAKEGKTKYDLGRERFLEEAWKWKDEYHKNITNQTRKMGASLDWSRERFTLDEGLHSRVIKAFVDLYNRGLIYRGEYMVNYSPGLNTVLSDEEVDYKEEKAKLYYITYFVSGSDAELVVATTRPETLLGDVAVAVNPKDKRYKKFIGKKKVILPILNKEIDIIGDEMVDMEFGTGAVKITPAHDPNDFEVAKRHNLDTSEVVLGRDGNMTDKAGIFAGQDYMTARENIVELLKSKGNLQKIEDYDHRVGYCSRSGVKVETIISKQWFIKTTPLAKKVMAGYKKKEFSFIPERYNKIFEHWMENMGDWCISRQLWWGHQIPAYYNKTTGEVKVCEEELDKKEPNIWERDSDVLDTWFSSAMWPFGTLDNDMEGKNHSEDFKKFYPAQVLETGYDIIPFWVNRMLMMGYEFTGKTPFEKVYIHGLVRDKLGRKFSKSLGNGVDPIEMIDKYGTDPLRLTLSIGNTPGNDMKFDEDNVDNHKLFVNKIWNAVRFVYTNILEKDGKSIEPSIEKLNKIIKDNYKNLLVHEKWILSRLASIIDLTTKGMDEFNFSMVGQDLYHFTKNEFCDYYIEEFKVTKESSKYGNEVISLVINSILKLWHPYIPYVTEELYKKLGFEGMVIDSGWPKLDLVRDEQIEKDKELVVDTIKQIRNIKAENNVLPSSEIKLIIVVKNEANRNVIEDYKDIISAIVKSEATEVTDKKPSDNNMSYGVIKAGVEVYIDTSNAIDTEKEIERLKEQIIDTKEYIAILDKKLLNEQFVKNAPESLVRKEMEKKEQAVSKLRKLEEKLGNLR